MAKLHKPDTPPSAKNLTKQQINNIMKSGPGGPSPALPPI
jgi:hypothetical protein